MKNSNFIIGYNNYLLNNKFMNKGKDQNKNTRTGMSIFLNAEKKEMIDAKSISEEALFLKHVEIIREKFPNEVTIEETELDIMNIYGNSERLLLKKGYYNEYCFVKMKSEKIFFTIFKSDWNNFEKIESDFLEGFDFAPKDTADTSVIIQSLT